MLPVVSGCVGIVGLLQHFLFQLVFAVAHTHCASRRDIHAKVRNIIHHKYAFISMWCAKGRRDTTFKTSVVKPYLRSTELMEACSCQPWIMSILKISLQARMRKSGVDLCWRAFFLSVQQCHVSHSKYVGGLLCQRTKTKAQEFEGLSLWCLQNTLLSRIYFFAMLQSECFNTCCIEFEFQASVRAYGKQMKMAVLPRILKTWGA